MTRLSKSLIFIILSLFIIKPIMAQEWSDNIETTLNNLYGTIMEAEDSDKMAINDSIVGIIGDYVESDSVFDHRFNNLRFLGQIVANDNKLKIINWNVMDSDGNNSYFSFIIRRIKKENKVYFLRGNYSEESIDINHSYYAENWYGALYYDLTSFRSAREVYYLALGYDYTVLGINRKIVEIIGFSDDDVLFFGMPYLEREGETLYRDVLEYSSEGIVSLRLNSEKTVIFDHLTSISESQNDNPENYGAALSFDAYVLEKGIWKYYSNVDIRNER